MVIASHVRRLLRDHVGPEVSDGYWSAALDSASYEDLLALTGATITLTVLP